MNIDLKDLKITVGFKAYENYTGRKLSLKDIHMDGNKSYFRSGVFVLHIPTNKKVYCNSEKNPANNRKIALKQLEKDLNTSNISEVIDNDTPYEIDLQYFKRNGDYVASGKYLTDQEDIEDILKEIKTMKENKTLPDVIGNDFIIYASIDKYPNGYPLLIL